MLFIFMNEYKKLTDLNNLHKAFLLCKKNVNWKSSVQRYEYAELINIIELREKLLNHTYKQRPFYEFDINERGKMRHIKSLHVSDRVLQRALCDFVLSPAIDKYLIYDNGASQKGKGINFSRRRIKTHLEKYYRHYGKDGYILQIDFSKYFDNINHTQLMRIFRKYIHDDEVLKLLADLLETFGNETSCGIGSQLSQVAGIVYPSEIDNYCKIVRGCKYYGRYMDDTYIIHNDKDFLIDVLNGIRRIADSLGIKINEKKTHIVKLAQGFTFLKMRYLFTDTGKIIVIPARSTITRERRRLKKIANRVSKADFENQYKSWRGNIIKYNSYKSVRNTDALYKHILEVTKWKNGKKSRQKLGN